MIQNGIASEQGNNWPALSFSDWQPTYETLHMWLQIIGKIRLTMSPYVNHWWQTPLYVTARGLTTSSIPYQGGIFEINLDFIDHNLFILTSEGGVKMLPLVSHSVADFYQDLMNCLQALGITVAINTLPNEIPNPIPLDKNTLHCTYDPVPVHNLWRILIKTKKVLQQYRSQFIGKSSPIHFFWGSFDLALTFFSGKEAPPRSGADLINREAYSHEVISCGFWPGNAQFPHPAFYSYAAPVPARLEEASIRPDKASFNKDLGEFLLLYEDVRTAPNPEQTLLDFFQSSYEASIERAGWDRSTLEKPITG